MERELVGEQAMERAVQELRDWRAAHPRATFRELEEAVEQQLQRVRAALLTDLAHDTAVPRPAHCPACGGRLRHAGERERTLALPGGAAVRLRRPYLHCPACGAGLFPPGRAAGTAAQSPPQPPDGRGAGAAGGHRPVPRGGGPGGGAPGLGGR